MGRLVGDLAPKASGLIKVALEPPSPRVTRQRTFPLLPYALQLQVVQWSATQQGETKEVVTKFQKYCHTVLRRADYRVDIISHERDEGRIACSKNNIWEQLDAWSLESY